MCSFLATQSNTHIVSVFVRNFLSGHTRRSVNGLISQAGGNPTVRHVNKCTTSGVKVNIMLFKTSENGTHIWIEWKWILNRANEWISIYTGDKRFNKKLADRWKMDSAIHSSHKMACTVLSLCVCMCFSVVSSSLIHYYVYSIKAWYTWDTYWYLCKDCRYRSSCCLLLLSLLGIMLVCFWIFNSIQKYKVRKRKWKHQQWNVIHKAIGMFFLE